MSSKNLSNFFKENKIQESDLVFCVDRNSEMSINEYSDYKSVKSNSTLDDDRSLCQMLRNLNWLTDFQHHYDIVRLLNFSNNSVITLTKLHNESYNNWVSQKRRRSDFSSKKRSEGLSYLTSPHHDVFKKIKHIYDLSSDNAREYCLEISYYIQKVNDKIYYYENT